MANHDTSGNDVVATSNSSTGYSYTNIAGAATTTLKSGAGKFVRLVINKAVASSAITIYDNTAGSGTKIATVTQPLSILQSQTSMTYEVAFATGLTIVTSSTDDITIVWI